MSLCMKVYKCLHLDMRVRDQESKYTYVCAMPVCACVVLACSLCYVCLSLCIFPFVLIVRLVCFSICVYVLYCICFSV